MKWCLGLADVISPPERQRSAESKEDKIEPDGLATAVQVAAAGGPVDEALQAVEMG
ncbi:hypothetical protein BC835DRAFT_1350488, partial [Cytidiella melzeri]